MGLVEADLKPEGLRGAGAQKLKGGGGDLLDVIAGDGNEVIVADEGGIGSDMLQADQRRVVAGLAAQSVDDVLLVIGQAEAAVDQAQHAVAVRTAAGEQAGAAGRAGGRGAMRLAKTDSLIGQALQIGRDRRVAVGAGEAPGVMGVDVENIGSRGGSEARGGRRLTGGRGLGQGGVSGIALDGCASCHACHRFEKIAPGSAHDFLLQLVA